VKGIIWLASYPKSGNTWFRVFLTNLLRDGDMPVSINELNHTPMASSRSIFDDEIGFEASDLTADEIDRLRPELYTHLTENSEEQLFMKIHDAYTYLEDASPLIPKASTRCALYFIRNPLDVAVSFAHHSGWDCAKSTREMANDCFAFCSKPDRLHSQLRQKLLSWSNHVLSWVDQTPFPVCVIRYEDMKSHPLKTFTKASRFAGLDHSDIQIQKALTFSSFDVMQQQEDAEGFHEKILASGRFFRKGEVGSWRDELKEDQANKIVDDHREVMHRFGYLDEKGKIIY
jgi:hypothetical protein